MKKIVWKRLWARKYSPFIAGAWMQIFTWRRGYDVCRNKLFVPEGNLYAIYLAENEFDQIVKTYTKFLMRQDIREYAKEYEDVFKDYLAWARRISKKDFSKLTSDELIDVLKDLYKRTSEFGEYQFLSFVVLEGPAATIERKLSRLPNGSNILQAISTPYRETKITRARLELLKLVASNQATKENIRLYAKKYAWIPIYEFIDKPWTVSDIEHQIAGITKPQEELDRYHKVRRTSLRRYRGYTARIKDQKLLKLEEIVHHFSFLKEMRDDYRRLVYYILRPFWKEVAKRTGLKIEETNQLLVNELIRVLRGNKKSVHSVVNLRFQQYALWLKSGKLKIYSGINNARRIAQKVSARIQSNVIKGVVACPGMVEGRVRIVFHQGEFGKFKKGDILVTTMTHPEFLPIMKLAKAIVTDEGGITCHAAIVSRELGAPCVIGTKIATKVFKDGDLVEVDANKGVIKKL